MSQGGWGQPPGGGGGYGQPPAGGGGYGPPPAGPPGGGWGAPPGGPPGGFSPPPQGMPPGFTPNGGGVGANVDGMEAASFGWNLVMKDPVTIIGGNFIALLCMTITGTLLGATSNIFQFAAIDMQRSDPEIYMGVIYGIKITAQVVNLVVASFFAGGYVKFMLNIARGNPYSIGDIFSETKLFGRMLVARFLVQFATFLGMMLCFVPGIILALGLSQTNYLIVDKGMEPIDAMKESWRITDGQKTNFFIWGLVAFGVALVGVLACCIGSFVSTPLIAIGSAFLHLRLTRQPTASPTLEGTKPMLDAAFLRELEALRRRLEIRARSGASGERTSRRRGSSSEFEDHRPYAPGDDPRRIDWAVYARTGEPFLKLFRAEEDVTARVLLDGSASMSFGAPPKLDHAKRFAAAVAYMTLAGLERAQLFANTEGRVKVSTSVRGRAGAPAFFREAAAVAPIGAGDLARGIDVVLRQSGRPGLLVVISDFFDAGPVLSALARARAAGHDLAIVQILAPEELDPRLEGDLQLEDSETGQTVELTADADAIDAYLSRLEGLCDELRSFARRHGATYVRTSSSDALDEPIRRFVSRTRDLQ